MKAKRDVETLIIGAGPAGLQLAYYLEKQQRDYLVLEAGENPGTFFATFPRHRKLLSINKVFTDCDDPEVNLRWDWNSLLSNSEQMLFKHYSKEYLPNAGDLQRYLADFATHFVSKTQYNTRVCSITRNETFTVLDQHGNAYACRRLIIATGLYTPYIPPVPGIEYGENYRDMSVAPRDFINQRVLIIGKGNSAFETANHLIHTTALIHLCSPTPVHMAWESHYVGDLRAINNDFLDTYQLKSQNAVLDAAIEKIERCDGKFVAHVAFTHARGDRRTIAYDRVLVCTGFRFDASIFDATCRPNLAIRDKFPAQTSAWESTNVPDVYFAGTLMQARDYRKAMSGFIHGFRYNIQALHRMLEQRYHGIAWPAQTLRALPHEVAERVLTRLNTSSALWLQPGFFCDLLVVCEQDNTVLYYEDVPVDYLHDTAFGQERHYYTISMEYGHFEGNPFNIERDPDPAWAPYTPYFHPILRRFCGATLRREHHILEDLESVWKDEQYVQSVQGFFGSELARVRDPETSSSTARSPHVPSQDVEITA